MVNLIDFIQRIVTRIHGTEDMHLRNSIKDKNTIKSQTYFHCGPWSRTDKQNNKEQAYYRHKGR